MVEETLQLARRSEVADRFTPDNPQGYRDLMVALRYAIPLQHYDALVPFFASAVRDAVGLPGITPDGDKDRCEADAAVLQRDGIIDLPVQVPAADLVDIHAHFEGAELTDYFGRVPGAWLLDDVPGDVGIAGYDDAVSKQCLPLLMLANHPKILARVSQYLGAIPTIDGLSTWWSFPSRPEARDAQLYHMDRHCYRFAKLFIYLTDVDQNAGPHTFVKGSHKVQATLQRRRELIAAHPERTERYDAVLRQQRKRDEDVEAFFGSDRIRSVEGKAGTAFLVDTGGFHKGELPRDNPRLVFQCTYMLMPNWKIEHHPSRNEAFFDAALTQYGTSISFDQLAYINRLIVTP